MKFNFKKALVLLIAGVVLSLPLIALYALVPEVLSLPFYTSIEHWPFIMIPFSIVFLVWGYFTKNLEGM